MKPQRKPWREPMLWLVFGLPLASIIASVSLVVIAVRSGGADAVRDDVQRVSQIQTSNRGPDDNARQLGLSAVLRADESHVEVIPVTGEFARAAPLQLTLQHPTRAGDDLLLELAPTTTGWTAALPLEDSHDWIVVMAPADGAWRLRGRLPATQRATRLAPSSTQ